VVSNLNCGPAPGTSIQNLNPEPQSKLAILRRRARLVGWPDALGQAALGMLQKLIAWASAARVAPIWGEHGLDPHLDMGRPW